MGKASVYAVYKNFLVMCFENPGYNNEKKTDFMDVCDLAFGRQLSDACAKYGLGGFKKARIE